jgi:hypothetical protein
MQIHLYGGEFADTANPILLWSATWTTDDFSPREIAVTTASDEFRVFPDGNNGYSEQVDWNDFAEGSGVITIVPAPPAAVIAVLVGLLSARRSR